MPRSSVLFLDTASPVVSVAVGSGGEVLAERTIELRRSAEQLLAAIEEVLAAAGLALGELAGVAALQGPGSFTGLRIGLATALGLHQALGLPATALPTLPLLAAAGLARPGPCPHDVVAAVDAIRGEWAVERFRIAGEPLAEVSVRGPALLAVDALADQAPCRLVGFGVGRLSAEPPFDGAEIELVEPPPLAPVAARRWTAQTLDWQVARLTSPIYFRPPSVRPSPRTPRGGP